MRGIKFYIFILSLSITTQSLAALPPESLSSIPDPSRNYANDLTKLSKQDGPKGDFFRLKLAEKKLKENDEAAAFKLLNKVSEPIFSFWRKVVLAETYLAKNKPRQVLALLRKLEPKPDYEVFFGEGLSNNLYKRALMTRYHANKKLNRDTKKDAAALVSNYPLDKKVSEILSEEDKDPPLTRKQKIDKLHALSLRYKYEDIPSLITAAQIKSTKLSKEETCRALFELGNGQKAVKGYRGISIETFKEVVKLKCGDYYAPRALYRLGYLRPGKGSTLPDQREFYLKKLYQEFPNHRLTDDAYYKLYKITSGQGRTSEAKKHYTKLMSLKKGDMKSELTFELAYPLYKKEKYKKAAAIFARALETESTADESYPRILYWYARSLEKTDSKKNQAKAKETYKDLVKKFPYSFYAILAAKRSGTKVKTPALPELNGTPPENGVEYFILIDEFNQDGYHEGAKVVFEFALMKHPEWENDNKEFIAKKLIESRNYRKAIDMASKHFNSGVYGPITGNKNDPMFAAFYPWAFQDKTKIGYQKSALPLGAIEGIMREESLFQQTARSWVGATGLMQLMPTTAAMLKRQNPDVNFAPALTDPESNIILGSTYLKDMKNYFKGQLPLAIMAYNAGPGNVNKWLRKFGELELDEFIEKIPLSETRNYVKRVMRTMQVYGSLYNEPYFENPTYFSFQIERTERQKPRSQRKKKRRKK